NPLGTHWFTLVTPPARGVVEVRGNSVIRYTADADEAGADALIVKVHDSGTPSAEVLVTVSVDVQPRDPFALRDRGCDTAGAAAPWWLALLALRRRRQGAAQPVP